MPKRHHMIITLADGSRRMAMLYWNEIDALFSRRELIGASLTLPKRLPPPISKAEVKDLGLPERAIPEAHK